jgi:6,7-dimethyl-8-ribityllumazine synthase
MQPHSPDEIRPDASDLIIAIVTSRYHADITDALRDGAVEAFVEAGGDPAALIHVTAPGTFELPLLCSHCCVDRGVRTPDAIVALGCVIRGETTHDRHINDAVAQHLMRLSVDTGIPIGFGVLTCENHEQAVARAGGAHGHKGVETMHAVLQSIAAIGTLDQPVPHQS